MCFAHVEILRYDHYCFLGMGDHYLQFDYTPDQVSFLIWYLYLVLVKN